MSIEMTHTILMTKGPEAPEFNDGKYYYNMMVWSACVE